MKSLMRNLLLNTLMSAALVVGASSAMAANLALSKHDMTTTSWGASGEICKFCHTPHQAQTLTDAPLWNHTTTAQAYTPYSSPTFTASGAVAGTPGPQSKMCLSCHDGTVAVDSYGTAGVLQAGVHKIGGDIATNTIGGSVQGFSLAKDHPVGFTVTKTITDAAGGHYNAPNLAGSSMGSPTAFPLYSGKMECATCHAVHDPGTSGFFLRIENTKSALCTSCHTL